jgi:hypothetical protein
MTAILSETRERLLRVITAQIPPERIAEIHFFAPIKQGGVESGVAVIAATREPAPSEPSVAEPPAESTERPEIPPPEQEETAAEPDAEVSEEPASERDAESPSVPDAEPAPEQSAERHVVYTARYRLTLKGPDRGKWETNVVAEADAPLITVDVVVRGVQRRVGDVEEPERMSGDDVRAMLEARAAAAVSAAMTSSAGRAPEAP